MAVEPGTDAVAALLVGRFETDRTLISDLFGKSGWRLAEASSRAEALDLLRRGPFHVVIAESDVPSWHWKLLLFDLKNLPNPPQLIVTSRHADDHLWSEVLNVGAFDVLSQPLAREETERVIEAARRHYDAPRRFQASPAGPVRLPNLA